MKVARKQRDSALKRKYDEVTAAAKTLLQDFNDAWDALDATEGAMRCLGDRVIGRRLSCPHCGSYDPTRLCREPKTDRKKVLVYVKGKGWMTEREMAARVLIAMEKG